MREEDIIKIRDIFNFTQRKRSLQKAITDERCNTIHLQGLIGSSVAIALSSLKDFDKCVIIVANDAEEAGYLYHDICQLSGDNKNVLFFPSGYKRAIKYGQTDQANAILRTEVLGRLSNQCDGRQRLDSLQRAEEPFRTIRTRPIPQADDKPSAHG